MGETPKDEEKKEEGDADDQSAATVVIDVSRVEKRPVVRHKEQMFALDEAAAAAPPLELGRDDDAAPALTPGGEKVFDATDLSRDIDEVLADDNPSQLVEIPADSDDLAPSSPAPADQPAIAKPVDPEALIIRIIAQSNWEESAASGERTDLEILLDSEIDDATEQRGLKRLIAIERGLATARAAMEETIPKRISLLRAEAASIEKGINAKQDQVQKKRDEVIDLINNSGSLCEVLLAEYFLEHQPDFLTRLAAKARRGYKQRCYRDGHSKHTARWREDEERTLMTQKDQYLSEALASAGLPKELPKVALNLGDTKYPPKRFGLEHLQFRRLPSASDPKDSQQTDYWKWIEEVEGINEILGLQNEIKAKRKIMERIECLQRSMKAVESAQAKAAANKLAL